MTALDSGKATCISPSGDVKQKLCWRRYDVEQFQKIEALIGQRMEKFEHEEEAALLLYERVTEAQKLATMQVCSAPAL